MTSPSPGATERFTLHVDEHVDLEARWDRPADMRAAVVFCHPDPLQRGSMTAPLMTKVTDAMVARGLAVLRFNFRGVGASSGRWGGGVGEVDDIAAAVDTAGSTHRDLALGIAGWSFGAVTSLHWQAREGSTLPWAGIAPPVVAGGTDRLPPPDHLAAAPRTFIIGDRDQFATVAQVEAYAAAAGAVVHVLAGSDHFFYFRERRVADLVTDTVCAGCPPPPTPG